MNINFSIIIPVFNKAKYIKECFNSVLNQKFSGTFEVIVVDDASTDESLGLLEDIAKNEPRIRLFKHETNKGQVVARKTGIDLAKGDYIMHVDADDWLLPNAFSSMYEKIVQFKPDVLVVNSLIYHPNGKSVLTKFVDKEEFTLNKASIQNAFYFHLGTKIVKREITENMLIGNSIVKTTADDFLYCQEILYKAKSFYKFPKAFYVGRINQDSLTQNTDDFFVLNNRIILLQKILELTLYYKPDKYLTKNTLIYIEKTILNYSLKIKLNKDLRHIDSKLLIDTLYLFPGLDLIRFISIKKALNNKIYLILYSFLRLGFLLTIRLIIEIYYRKLKESTKSKNNE